MHAQVQQSLRQQATRRANSSSKIIATSLGFRAQGTRRCLSLRATPSTTSPALSTSTSSSGGVESTPDARFEVVGAPYSLLSASLSPSQILHTRRGTLVGLTGKPDNTISTLKILAPLSRLPLRIPFLYQRIISTSPTTALIATKSTNTSFSVINLDGTKDWMVAQRSGLLAWTGHSLTVTPKWNLKLSISQWGHTQITGRGLLALVGRGQIYSIDLKPGEEFIAHPSNVLAYTLTSSSSPLPYRFKSSTWTLSPPTFGLGAYLASTNLLKNLSDSDTWKAVSRTFRTLRTWSRRTIFGDRLFLQFQGPMTMLMQSRGAAVSESLSDANVNEIFEEVGQRKIEQREPDVEGKAMEKESVVEEEKKPGSNTVKTSGVHVASVGKDGKVAFEDVKA